MAETGGGSKTGANHHLIDQRVDEEGSGNTAESPGVRISLGDRHCKYFMNTKSQESGADQQEASEPRQVSGSDIAFFNLVSNGATNWNVKRSVEPENYSSGVDAVSHMQPDARNVVRGLTPEQGLSPNEIIFPQRIPMIDSTGALKYEGSIDSMAVIEQLEAAEQKEKQMALAAAESQITQHSLTAYN